MNVPAHEKTEDALRAETFISKSPALIFFFIVLTVFASEAMVMLGLNYFPQLSLLAETFTDAVLLVLLISPALYFLLFQPMVTHIRERQKVEATLHKNKEEQFKVMVRASLDGFWLTDMRGRFLEVNYAYCGMMGYSRDELLTMGISDVEATETTEDAARHIAKLMEVGSVRFETRHRRKDGSILDIEVGANHTHAHGGQIYCFLRDITERKRSEIMLRENEARLKDLFENLSSGVAVYRTSLDGRNFIFTAFNQAAERIENLRRDDVIGKNVADVFPGITESGLLEAFKRVWQSGVSEHFPVSCYQDGRISGWRENYIYKLPNGEVVAIYDDLTKEKQAEEKMHYLAHYDALTSLPNRTLFADRIHQSLAIAKRNKAHLALLFLDLDKFKPVNDELGHGIGDLLLKEAAKRLQQCVRESDTVSRIGGDEFVVLLPAIKAETDAMLVTEKILHAFIQPFELAGHCISISASIGVAVYPEHGSDEIILTRNADTAMYYAKGRGRNRALLYQSDMVGS